MSARCWYHTHTQFKMSRAPILITPDYLCDIFSYSTSPNQDNKLDYYLTFYYYLHDHFLQPKDKNTHHIENIPFNSIQLLIFKHHFIFSVWHSHSPWSHGTGILVNTWKRWTSCLQPPPTNQTPYCLTVGTGLAGYNRLCFQNTMDGF